jgi:hypothetical protein
MFVNQPDIPVPLVAEFPFPAWATRPAEAGAPPQQALRSKVSSTDAFTVVGKARRQTVPDDEIPF